MTVHKEPEEDLVILLRENIKQLLHEHVLIGNDDALVFTAVQLLYIPKHNVGETFGSHVFEELIWHNQSNGDRPNWVAHNAMLQPDQCKRINDKGYQRSLRSLLRRDAQKLAKVFLDRVEDCRWYTKTNNASGANFAPAWCRELSYIVPLWYHNTEISPNNKLPPVADHTTPGDSLDVIARRGESSII